MLGYCFEKRGKFKRKTRFMEILEFGLTILTNDKESVENYPFQRYNPTTS